MMEDRAAHQCLRTQVEPVFMLKLVMSNPDHMGDSQALGPDLSVLHVQVWKYNENQLSVHVV